MKACAYVIGPGSGPGSALQQMAQRVGFDVVRSFRGVDAAERQAEQTPLLFFLFGAVGSIRSLRRTAEAIRRSPSPRVRFSPMIYFADSPSLDAIRACINLGFDDVITLPVTMRRVVDRLSRQLEQRLVYYETESYFGPDRRGRIEGESDHHGRGSGGQYRRFEIMRSPAQGVTIVSDEVHLVV